MKSFFRSTIVLVCVLGMCPIAVADDLFTYEVTVQAQKEKADSVFDTDTIVLSNSAAAGQDLGQVLANQNGVDISSSGYPGSLTTARVRGGSSSQSLVSIDDVPLNSAQSGVFDLSLFNPGLFTVIETVKGGSSSVFGANAAAGYMNLVLPGMPESSALEYGSLTGSYGRNRNTARIDGRLTKNFGMSLLLLYDTAKNDFPYEYSGSNYTRQNSAFANAHAAVSLFWSGASWKSTFDAIYSHKAIGVPGMLPAFQNDKAFEKDDDAVMILKNVFYVPLYTEVTASWFHYSLLYDDVLAFPTPERSVQLNDQFFCQALQMADLRGFSLSYGLEGRWNLVDSSDIGDKSRLLGSQFLSVQRALFDKRMKLAARYRLEYSSIYGPVLDYNAGFNVKIPAGFLVRLNYGTAFREPTFNELYWSIPMWMIGANPDLKPERSRNLDFGVENRFFKFAEIKVSGFFNNFDNLIVSSTNGNGGWYIPRNLSKAVFYGVEAALELTFGEFLAVSAGYTKLYAVNRAAGVNMNKFIPYQPFDRLNLRLSAKYRIASLTANYRYTGAGFTTPDNIDSPDFMTKPVSSLDLSVAVKVRHVTASIAALNVLKTFNFSNYGEPMMGRTINVELRYRGSLSPGKG